MEYIQVAIQRDLKENIKNEIDRLERIEWPNSTIDGDDQIQFLYYKDTFLVAHVGVIEKSICIDDISYKIAGISGVITHPNIRGRGFAYKLLKEATLYMIDHQVDFSLFTCHQDLVYFYQKAGWIKTDNIIFCGTIEHPIPSSQYGLFTMMKMLSTRTKENSSLMKQDIILELEEGKLW